MKMREKQSLSFNIFFLWNWICEVGTPSSRLLLLDLLSTSTSPNFELGMLNVYYTKQK